MRQYIKRRLLLIDALRGIAIVLMVGFHFCFDLAYFRLAEFDFYNDPFWLHARTFILSSFLLLVGVGLVMANRTTFVLHRYMKRLLPILAAALLVSFSTWWIFAERVVFFGVLHFIAAASVIGLLFVRLGWFNLLLGAVLIGIGLNFQSVWFDMPGWRWIGLMTYKPQTEDYVPLLPWFGVVLIGMAFTPMLENAARRKQQILNVMPAKALAYAGRYSLIIYLLHQPLLMGLLSLFAGVGY
ncbi:Mlr1315 protein [hydrothermal vent metagenome]|uniref:Mlr1315 protein n=1 Tax=hydrothermal vent metagenome TaxID=652676 RepID=A0A3B0ZK16_9ZZZZ